MSASFLLLRNSFPSSGGHQNGNECGCGKACCFSYDAQTCCLVILPVTAAIAFFIWLFFQKGHLAVGLVLAQLFAIVFLGILAFLLAVAIRRCWRRFLGFFWPKRKNMAENGGGEGEDGGGNEQQKQRV